VTDTQTENPRNVEMNRVDSGPMGNPIPSSAESGVLDPVNVEHMASAVWSTQSSFRNDVNSQMQDDVFLPAGASGNEFSAFCTGGYFLVGAGGSTDFGSSAGTISLWLNWNATAPQGRFWGQHQDFETRWSGGALVLDWGVGSALTGSKTNWEVDHWYFIAIVWDDTSNFLGIYWGDEANAPSEDASTSLWTSDVLGRLTENNIMNSMARTTQMNGLVDDFRYYTAARSITDIRSDYLSELSGSESNLTHYYEFDNDLEDRAGSVSLVEAGTYSFSRDMFSRLDGWKGTQIELSVDELKRLYALNGTFETGSPGINQDWGGDGSYYAEGWRAQREVVDFRGRQRAIYVSDDPGYVVLENEGYPNATGTGYWHFNDTRIFWYQTVDNSELNEDFVFGLDYMYMSGPIGSNFEGMFALRFEIRDGSTVLWNWSIDITSISLRQNWYSVDFLNVSIPSAPSTFEARIVLEITTPSTYIEIPEDNPDLDGDATNGLLLTFQIDDVSLTGAQLPDCESVDLQAFNSDIGFVDIIGYSGSGIALLNYSSWEYVRIPISLSANSSLSMDFSAKVSRMIRSLNSSSSESLESQGVSFEIALDHSANLSLFTYIESYPEAEDIGFMLSHPNDWENATVEDPFGQDFSGQAVIGTSTVEIPSGLANEAGWWEIRLNGPNYAKAVTTQKFNDSNTIWYDESIFGNDDRIRCSATIGTSTENPTAVYSLEANWFQPFEMPWSSDIVSNGTGSVVTSTARTLGSSNATTGTWMVTVFWTNGSEAAYGFAIFELHHEMNLFAHTPTKEVQLDEIFTVAMYLYDQDTGDPILSGEATMVGNWSGGNVYFSPNLAKEWWEADFNSTLAGPGTFVITVNASMQFHVNTSSTVSVQVLTLTVLTVLGNQFVEIGTNNSHEAKVRYMFLEGTGIENANISILTWSGPSGGLSYGTTSPVPSETGNYSITFSANLSGTYIITIAGTKQDHSTAATSFYLIVGAVPTELDLLNGSSAIVSAADEYQLTIRYTNETGAALSGANLTIISCSPEEGLDFQDAVYHGNGMYSVSIEPTEAGTFYIVLRVNLTNHQSQIAFFTLSVFPIASSLNAVPSTGTVSIDRQYTVFLSFRNETLGGLENANISILSINPDAGVLASDPVKLGYGNYSITLTPLAEGTYEIVFRAVLPRYQNGTTSFVLFVTKVPTSLRTESGAYSGYSFFPSVYSLGLFYERTDTWLNISGASFVVTEVDGLSYVFSEYGGMYTLEITPTVLGKWSLTITAYLDQHNNASIIFEFEVRENTAELSGSAPPDTFYYNETYVFSLTYQTLSHTGIENAIVSPDYNPVISLEWTETGNGEYVFSIRIPEIGPHMIFLRFAKYGYEFADESFSFDVVEVPTEIIVIGVAESYYEGRQYNFALHLNSTMGNGVGDCEVVIASSIRSFFIVMGSGDGWHNFTFIPEYGDWNATFWMSMMGYQEQEFSFFMRVVKIPVLMSPDYPINQTYTQYEGSVLPLEIAPIAGDSRMPILGAAVSYTLHDTDGNGDAIVSEGIFVEDEGVYSASITVPGEGLYRLSIRIIKDHFEEEPLEIFIDSEVDEGTLAARAWTAGILGALALSAVVSVVAIGRRFYISTTAKRNAELLAMQNRFNDAKNLIGILVIHRRVGLPLYSKIIKGAFEESMISSFIAALTQFRSEFSDDEPIWTTIPITEVISAVQTQELICAVVTVESASERQKGQLEAFSKEVGSGFDEKAAEIGAKGLPPDIAVEFQNVFEPIFNLYFDGVLLSRYVGVKKTLPKTHLPVSDSFASSETTYGIGLEPIVKDLILKGHGELKSYSMVVEAVDGSHLIPAITEMPTLDEET
jgi:hypothetical protein